MSGPSVGAGVAAGATLGAAGATLGAAVGICEDLDVGLESTMLAEHAAAKSATVITTTTLDMRGYAVIA